MRRRDEATNRNALGSPHFMDMEGNLEVARVRSTLLASRLDAPKGWGQGHTHVAVSTSICTQFNLRVLLR